MRIVRRASNQQKSRAQEAASKQPSYVGSRAHLRVNQGWRPCHVLACIGGELLVEYALPHGLTALAFAQAPVSWPTRRTKVLPQLRRIHRRPCSYRTLTKAWLSAVCSQRGVWMGRSHAGAVPTPHQLFAERFPHRTTAHLRVTQGWQKISGPPLPPATLERRKTIGDRLCVIEQSPMTGRGERWCFILRIGNRIIHQQRSRYANAWATLASLAHERCITPAARAAAS